MQWISLTEEAQLLRIKNESYNRIIAIFKHSTRCSISSMAKNRLERDNDNKGVIFYYLDLLNYRLLSSKIAEEFDVKHESPQILLIKNGVCIYTASHNGISMPEIMDSVSNLAVV